MCRKKRYVKVVHSVERTSLGSSRKVGFERRMSTGKVLFAYFGSGFAKTLKRLGNHLYRSKDTEQGKRYHV